MSDSRENVERYDRYRYLNRYRERYTDYPPNDDYPYRDRYPERRLDRYWQRKPIYVRERGYYYKSSRWQPNWSTPRPQLRMDDRVLSTPRSIMRTSPSRVVYDDRDQKPQRPRIEQIRLRTTPPSRTILQ